MGTAGSELGWVFFNLLLQVPVSFSYKVEATKFQKSNL